MNKMKIAIVTDDGKTISAHFGRAQGFLVVTPRTAGKPVAKRAPGRAAVRHRGPAMSTSTNANTATATEGIAVVR